MKKISRLVLFFLFTGLLFLGVMSFLHKKEPIPQFVEKPLVIGTSHSFNAALLLIAEWQDLFKKNGLNVSVEYYSSASKAFQAMLAGEIDMAAVAETPVVQESFLRNDFQIFTTIGTFTNDPKIVGRKSHQISKPEDLVGKNIGSTPYGQSASFFLYLFRLQHNISSESVTIIENSPKKLVTMLQKGEIDAVSLFEPYVSLAAKTVGGDAVILSSPGLYRKTFNLVAKVNYLETHTAPAQGVIKTLVAAEKFFSLKPDISIEHLAERLSLPVSVVTTMNDQSSFNVELSPELLITLTDQANWFAQNKTDKHLPDINNFVFADILEHIMPSRNNLTKIKR